MRVRLVLRPSMNAPSCRRRRPSPPRRNRRARRPIRARRHRTRARSTKPCWQGSLPRRGGPRSGCPISRWMDPRRRLVVPISCTVLRLIQYQDEHPSRLRSGDAAGERLHLNRRPLFHRRARTLTPARSAGCRGGRRGALARRGGPARRADRRALHPALSRQHRCLCL